MSGFWRVVDTRQKESEEEIWQVIGYDGSPRSFHLRAVEGGAGSETVFRAYVPQDKTFAQSERRFFYLGFFGASTESLSK